MASYNGAKYCNVDDRKGQIKENFDADLVVFDENIEQILKNRLKYIDIMNQNGKYFIRISSNCT